MSSAGYVPGWLTCCSSSGMLRPGSTCLCLIGCTQAYGFTVNHAYLSRDVMLYSCCMSVAGTKVAISEMLETALEHEILHEG